MTHIKASSQAAVAIDAAEQKLCFPQPTSDYTTNTNTGGKIMAQCFSPLETGDNVTLA
jgi:hypothetical protein